MPLESFFALIRPPSDECMMFLCVIPTNNKRCGYTGEDGFELAMPADHAVSIASRLLSDPNVNPAGLGARDSLRLEAGLCLYGHDLDGSINPIEATLAWTMGGPKSRRRVEGGFLGAEKILKPDGGLVKADRKRVGISGMKSPAREGAEIYDAEGERLIGKVTSGTFSPCLKGETETRPCAICILIIVLSLSLLCPNAGSFFTCAAPVVRVLSRLA